MTGSLLCVTAAGEDVPAALHEAAALLGVDAVAVSPAMAASWEAAGAGSVAGVLAWGSHAARAAARVAAARGLAWHSQAAVRVATAPLLARGRLLAAGVPVPWFVTLPPGATIGGIADCVSFPCLIGPAATFSAQQASQVTDPAGLESRVDALRARGSHESDGGVSPEDDLLIEGVPAGRLTTVEGVLERGALRVFAMFEEEVPTAGGHERDGRVWVSPPSIGEPERRYVATMVARALLALGLHHGPVHARCQIDVEGVRLVSADPWAVTGALARALRFATVDREGITLDELLVRHALGALLDGFGPEAGALRVVA